MGYKRLALFRLTSGTENRCQKPKWRECLFYRGGGQHVLVDLRKCRGAFLVWNVLKQGLRGTKNTAHLLLWRLLMWTVWPVNHCLVVVEISPFSIPSAWGHCKRLEPTRTSPATKCLSRTHRVEGQKHAPKTENSCTQGEDRTMMALSEYKWKGIAAWHALWDHCMSSASQAENTAEHELITNQRQ